MRQIGTLPTPHEAQRFTAYLITQDIPAQAESEGDVFTIWAKNEDQVAQAKEALEHFRINPQDARYQGVEARATAKVHQEQQARERSQENVVDIRTKWKSGQNVGMRQAPFTYALIGLSILVFVLSLGQTPQASPRRYLGFVSPQTYDRTQMRIVPPKNDNGSIDGLYDIRHGQFWRLVTPIFIHFNVMHIAFNALMLHSFGRRVEAHIGTWRMALLVLAIALVSNLAQYLWAENPNFGGLSGVVYGVFGFIWVKSRFFPEENLYVDGSTVFIMLAWLFACIAAEFPPLDQVLTALRNVANAAHVMGLVTGIAISALPLLWKKR